MLPLPLPPHAVHTKPCSHRRICSHGRLNNRLFLALKRFFLQLFLVNISLEVKKDNRLYTHIYIYIYIYTYVYIHVCVCVYIYKWRFMCI